MVLSPLILLLIFLRKRVKIGQPLSLCLLVAITIIIILTWVSNIFSFGNLLFVDPDSSSLPMLAEMILLGDESRNLLLILYSLWLSILIISYYFVYMVWRWDLGASNVSKQLRLFYTILIVICTLFMPINYGLLVLKMEYPNVVISTEHQSYEGILLNRKLYKPNELLVLYKRGSQEISITNYSDVRSIMVTHRENIFTKNQN